MENQPMAISHSERQICLSAGNSRDVAFKINLCPPVAGSRGQMLRIARAEAIELHRELGEYIESTHHIPTTLLYNSQVGWSYSASDYTSGSFSTEEAARADLKSNGYQVQGEPTNGN